MTQETNIERHSDIIVPDVFGGYSDTIDPDLLTVAAPYLKIGQPQSKAVIQKTIEQGHFYINTNSLETFPQLEQITCVPMRNKQPRSRATNENGVFTVHCRSRDGIRGEGDPGGLCSRCKYAQWINKKQLCPPSISFQMFIVEWGIIAIWGFQKSSWPIGKEIVQMCASHGFRNFALTATTFLEEKGDLVYCVPAIDFLEDSIEELGIILPQEIATANIVTPLRSLREASKEAEEFEVEYQRQESERVRNEKQSTIYSVKDDDDVVDDLPF